MSTQTQLLTSLKCEVDMVQVRRNCVEDCEIVKDPAYLCNCVYLVSVVAVVSRGFHNRSYKDCTWGCVADN